MRHDERHARREDAAEKAQGFGAEGRGGMSVAPYPEYKDSGVEWIGQVPAHWRVGKLGHFCHLRSGFAFASDAFGIEGVAVVRMNNLRRGRLELGDAARIPESACVEAASLAEGDLVWGMSGSTGETGSLGNHARVFAEDLPCQLNQRVGRFEIRECALETKFLELMIQTNYFYEQIMLFVTGTAQYNVSAGQVQSCIVAIPSINEQEAIAAFLDQETGKIDALVAEQERLIALLKEKRQAVISQAVTKGLNPNAPMKDSGI
ncbi:MAG: restriction endonuclease subunit S, partial [Acetobacteraceae bacterium]